MKKWHSSLLLKELEVALSHAKLLPKSAIMPENKGSQKS
jgi:hypothetical protein